MNFNKFIKSIGTDGTIYNRGENERWLASGSVFMRIPENTKSVMAQDITEMPSEIRDILYRDYVNEPCRLTDAVMPFASGVIKNCIRVFTAENETVKIAISNDDYSLIQKDDLVTIHAPYSNADGSYSVKALIVSTRPITPDEEPQIVGIIFPTEYNEI